jgi:hypothetical protein
MKYTLTETSQVIPFSAACICLRVTVLVLLVLALAASAAFGAVQVYHTSPDLAEPGVVPQSEVFEFTIEKDVNYGTQENIKDVTLILDFTDPVSSAVTTINGFYYHTRTDGTSLWKARFTTRVTGIWSYNFTLTHVPSGTTDTGTGLFECVTGSSGGFVRINPSNNFRWVLDDGSPFVPLGINWAGSVLDGGDGQSGIGNWSVGYFDRDEYLSIMRGAGINMMRFKGGKGHTGLLDSTLATFFPNQWINYDERMRKLRKADIRIFYGIFGNKIANGAFGSSINNDQKRLIEDSISRWGAYVDVWQLTNENKAPYSWTQSAAAYVKLMDPYQHPVCESYYWYETPAAILAFPEIDLHAPHWYKRESEYDSDTVTAGNASFWKTAGKPVFVGEQGNSVQSWLTDSARRLRIRTWTAFFNELSFFLFPSNATTRTGSIAANIWIGPEERQFLQIMQRFSEAVIRTDTVMMSMRVLRVSNPSAMRAYGLSSSDGVALYLHHYSNHSSPLSGESVTFTSPAAGQGYWIDPITGQVVSTVAVAAGSNMLIAPDFTIDLAFLSTAGTLEKAPVAVVSVNNTQWAASGGDLDGDGSVEDQPGNMAAGFAPLTIDFDASQSSDWDGGDLIFTWDFGDGQTATGAVQSHTYTVKGAYIACVTVTDDEGHSVTVGLGVRSMADLNPNANDPPLFRNIPDVTVRAGNVVSIGGVEWYSFDMELISGSYTMDTITNSAGNLPPGAQFLKLAKDAAKTDPTNRLWWVPGFDQAGLYTVQFDASDDENAMVASKFVTITVIPAGIPALPNQSPVALIAVTSTDVATGEDPGLDGSGSSDPDGTIQSYEWDFRNN